MTRGFCSNDFMLKRWCASGFGSRGTALGRVILESVGLSTYDTRPNVKFKLDDGEELLVDSLLLLACQNFQK